MKLLTLLMTMFFLMGCDPELPDLTVERGIHINPAHFEIEVEETAERGDYLVYKLPSGLAEWDPEIGIMTLYSDLDIEPEHQLVLGVYPEVIPYHGEDVFRMTQRFISRDETLCYSHEYTVLSQERVSESLLVDTEKCWKGMVVFYSGWTNIASWVLTVLSKFDIET